MPVALVQEADAPSASVTLGASATAGNTVVVAVACLGGTPATGVTGITLGGAPDNFALVTPGPSAQDTTAPDDYINVSVWADPDCAGGSAAISVTGTGVLAVWAWEFSGLASAPENWQVFPVSSYQDSWVTAIGQTTVPAQAWLAVMCAANQTATPAPAVNNTTGWTLDTAYSGTSGSYDWAAVSAYQTVNTVGTPAWSGSFGQQSFSVTILVTFPAAPLAAPPPPAVAGTPIAHGVSVSGGSLQVTGSVNAAAVNTSSLNFALPSSVGFAAWAYDYVMLNGQFTDLPSSGTVSLVMCPVQAAARFAALRYWIPAGGGGSGLTAGQNFLGVYSSAGGLICASTDQTTTWSGTGVQDYIFAGGPFTVTPPWVWVAFLCNGASGPGVANTLGGPGTSAVLANGRLPASRSRFGQLPGAFTSLPASFSPTSITRAPNEYWAALF